MLGLAIAAIAVACAVAFALSGGPEAGRAVREAVLLHADGPNQLAPAVLPDADAPRDTFSDFAARAGWVPTGAREDRIAGRSAATVFWERGGRRLAYTSIAGALPPPVDARRTGRRGVLLRSVDVDERVVVTWVEDGRTVVVSAVAVPRAELYDLVGGPPRRRG